MSEADELLKYKDLLDSGIITQEEFEKKKKEVFKTEYNTKDKKEKNITNSTHINNKVKNEPKELGKINKIISWIFCVLFIFATLGSLISGFNFVELIIYVIIALICCPPVIKKVQKITKIKITTAMRIIAIFVCLMIYGFTMTDNYKPKVDVNTQQTGETKNEQPKGDSSLALIGTSGKDFFNRLCNKAGITPRKSAIQKGNYILYAEANMNYSINVDSSLDKDEIMDFEITHYYDEGDIDKEILLISTELKYEGSNKEELTNWINNNLGKNAEIKIGSLTFTLKNSDEKYVSLYARTDKYEETYIKK